MGELSEQTDESTQRALGQTYTGLLSALIIWVCVAHRATWSQVFVVSFLALSVPYAAVYAPTHMIPIAAPIETNSSAGVQSAGSVSAFKRKKLHTSRKSKGRSPTDSVRNKRSNSSAKSGKTGRSSRNSSSSLPPGREHRPTTQSLLFRTNQASQVNAPHDNRGSLSVKTPSPTAMRERRYSHDSIRSESPRRTFKNVVAQLKSRMPAVHERLHLPHAGVHRPPSRSPTPTTLTSQQSDPCVATRKSLCSLRNTRAESDSNLHKPLAIRPIDTNISGPIQKKPVPGTTTSPTGTKSTDVSNYSPVSLLGLPLRRHSHKDVSKNDSPHYEAVASVRELLETETGSYPSSKSTSPVAPARVPTAFTTPRSLSLGPAPPSVHSNTSTGRRVSLKLGRVFSLRKSPAQVAPL
ncbi:hypothetical protein PYCC9005_001385 [Savitreella phatthalungensis]